MASRHHHRDHGHCHRHNHREPIPMAAAVPATSPCRCNSTPCCTQSDHLPPPPPSLDHLLGLVSAYLEEHLQESRCRDQTRFCESQCRSFNGFRGQGFVRQEEKNPRREYDSFVVSCLLRKIEDLEFSLNRISVSSNHRRASYFTLRDSAARVIQTHFRAYLVRRSRSLRQLRVLSAIKSSFLSLKSSVSGKTHFPFEAVSREAMDLLMQLDSIQSRDDPMLRDGKRSVSRDLVRFLQYVDGCAVKRHEIVCKSAKDVSVLANSSSKCRSLGSKRQDFCSYEGKNAVKLNKRMENIFISSSYGDKDNNVELEQFGFVTDDGEGIPVVCDDNRKVGNWKSRILVKGNDAIKSRLAGTVRFDRNGNVYQVYRNAHEDDSADDEEEILAMHRSSKISDGVSAKGIGGKTRVVKTVSFDEKGNVYRVYGDTPESSSGGDGDNSTNGSNSENGDGEENDDNEAEEIKCVPKVNEGAEEKAHSEDEESSSQGSEGEIALTRTAERELFQRRKGGSMFSPPLPLKMEP